MDVACIGATYDRHAGLMNNQLCSLMPKEWIVECSDQPSISIVRINDLTRLPCNLGMGSSACQQACRNEHWTCCWVQASIVSERQKEQKAKSFPQSVLCEVFAVVKNRHEVATWLAY